MHSEPILATCTLFIHGAGKLVLITQMFLYIHNKIACLNKITLYHDVYKYTLYSAYADSRKCNLTQRHPNHNTDIWKAYCQSTYPMKSLYIQ